MVVGTVRAGGRGIWEASTHATPASFSCAFEWRQIPSKSLPHVLPEGVDTQSEGSVERV